MRTILVEEWVNIPEGGKPHNNHANRISSYCDCKDKISEGEGSQRRDHQELQAHASWDENHEAAGQEEEGSLSQHQDVVRRCQAELLCLNPQVSHPQHDLRSCQRKSNRYFMKT